MAEALQAILNTSLSDIQAGKARSARERLESQIATGTRDASLFLVLAHACKTLGDGAAMESAVDEALQIDPRSMNALVMKGDLLMARNDMPAAAGYYDYLIKLAEAAGFPAEMQILVDYSRKCQARCTEVLNQHLQVHLEKTGYAHAKAPARFNHALDLLTGKRQIFHQNPRAFYFPELPQIQFYDPAQFDWVAEIEELAGEIAYELQRVMEEPQEAFTPYLTADSRLAGSDPQKVRDNEGWRAFYLWQDGKVVLDNAIRCPQTMAALEKAPLTKIRSRAPSALFSLLKPGARIAPHTGFINTRLICHLPLIVPDNCALRVGNETRPWQAGKMLIFDDTIEHEAWNRSDQTRVVLIFDIWRPELSLEERRLVSSLLEGVDSFAVSPGRWED